MLGWSRRYLCNPWCQLQLQWSKWWHWVASLCLWHALFQCWIQLRDKKVHISLTFKVIQSTDESELKFWLQFFTQEKKATVWWALFPCGLLWLPCTWTANNAKTQECIGSLSRSAPWLGQGSPHSSVSVCKGFCAPPQSLQKANLARAERQSKTRHPSSWHCHRFLVKLLNLSLSQLPSVQLEFLPV